MRVFFGFLLLVGALFAMPAQAQQANITPMLGSWSLDVERLAGPAEARPKSVVLTFGPSGDGKWLADVTIIAPDGTPMQGGAMFALNGVPAGIEGNPVVDTAAVTTPAPGVLVMAQSNGGKPVATRIYTLAKDGGTLTETAVYFTGEGVPAIQTNSFTRVRP